MSCCLAGDSEEDAAGFADGNELFFDDACLEEVLFLLVAFVGCEVEAVVAGVDAVCGVGEDVGDKS